MITFTNIPLRGTILFTTLIYLGCSGCSQDSKQNNRSIDSAAATTDDTSIQAESWDSENVEMNITWLPVAKGTFTYGSPEDFPCQGGYDEKEVQVTLTNSFVMAETEVTQQQWVELGFSLPEPLEYKPDYPIAFVSFFDAAMWCNRMSIAEGLDTCYDLNTCTGPVGSGCGDEESYPEQGCRNKTRNFSCEGDIHRYENHYECPGYRLPTTAEWEYAAKAGTTGHTYNGEVHYVKLSFCEEEPSLNDIAWYCDNADDSTHPVRQKHPNPWGFYDILGNVAEWVDYPNQGVPIDVAEQREDKDLTDPQGPAYGDEYTLKGGFYYLLSGCYLRPSYHVYNGPHVRKAWSGFRPVRTLFGDEAAAVTANPTPNSNSQGDTK